MPISAADALTLAFDHTKHQLFRPFRIGQWARLALVGALAGELSSGGCSFRVPQLPSGGGSPQHFPGIHFPAINFVLLGALITVLVVLGLLLWLVFAYLNSIMRFILFDSVLAKECHIRQAWKRRQGPAIRYFVWLLTLAAVAFAGLVILVGLPAGFGFAVGWLRNPGAHVLPLVLCGLALFFILAAFFIGLAVVAVFSKDFVVPQMAMENITAFEAWRRLLPMLRQDKGGYAGYIGMKILMSIGAAILVGIVSVIVVILLLIPVGGVGVAAVLVGKAAGLGWNLYTISLAVIVGCIAIAAMVYVLSLVSVPVVVFFPAYSIYFFAARYRPLALVLYPPPPAPPAPPPPPEPPPLPPEALPAS